MAEMDNSDKRVLHRVFAGPYKDVRGWLVPAADVRGSADMSYIEDCKTGYVFEVSPKHLEKLGAKIPKDLLK